MINYFPSPDDFTDIAQRFVCVEQYGSEQYGSVLIENHRSYVRLVTLGHEATYRVEEAEYEQTALCVKGTALVLFQRSQWDWHGKADLKPGDSFTCPQGWSYSLSNVGPGKLCFVVALNLTLGDSDGEPAGPREAGASQGIRQGEGGREQEAGGDEEMAATGAAEAGEDRSEARPQDEEGDGAVRLHRRGGGRSDDLVDGQGVGAVDRSGGAGVVPGDRGGTE